MIYLLNVKWTFLFATLFTMFASTGQNSDGDRYSHVESSEIDAIFSSYDNTTGGCVVGIADRGELIFSGGYGMANLDYGIPLEPDSRLMIASISKQFAAAAMLMMEQEGYLDLDEDIRTYIPEMPEFDEPVTTRMLIHHTSGLRDYFNLLSLKEMGLDPTFTYDEAIEMLSSQQALNFRPGTQHLYSNSGYFLMSVIVKNLTDMSMREYTDKHFFQPLGMESTHFHDDLEMNVPNRAMSYRPGPDGPGQFYRDNIDRVGDRALFTTIEDFAKWEANFIENRTNLENFTEKMTRKGVFRNGREHNYAAGLRINSYRTLDTVGHGGNYMGFRSSYVRFPEQELGIMVFCNMSNISPAPYANQLADLFLMKEFEEIFEEYKGLYRNDGFNRNYEIIMDDGDLYLKKGLRDKERLVWRNNDRFSAGSWDVRFQRNDDDEIEGFTVETGRTGRVTFERSGS